MSLELLNNINNNNNNNNNIILLLLFKIKHFWQVGRLIRG